MELASECKRLESLVHVSTAYTNANFEGLVEEKVYELAGHSDPEESIQNILGMNPQYIQDNEKMLTCGYPNTYTFTKSMAERTIQKRYK
jgi:fatty acyl-CoA reductase